jgi:hypothetical protein
VPLRHRPHRVLYVPLDDRPCNYKTPRLLAQMVDYEFTAPPAELLGRFREPGQADEVCRWLLAHADPALDCIILSLDMLAYGGLWASRASSTRTRLAHERLNVVGDLRERCPQADIFGFSSVLQLGTVTSSDEGAQHRDSLARYSVLSGRVAATGAAEDRARLTALERQIPASVLGEYLAIRGRNHEINLRAIREVAEGNLDLLVIGQDVAGAEGVHLEEQRALLRRAAELGAGESVRVVCGVDQLASCLFARFVHQHMEKLPLIRVVAPHDPSIEGVAPGEDRAFRQTLSEHVDLVGARLATEGTRAADMVLAVNSPPGYERKALRDPQVLRTHRERARDLLQTAASAARGRALAVADCAFAGGADDIFVQELISTTPELPGLLAFAGSDTASAAVGSALAHGTLRLIALQDKGAFDLARVVGDLSALRYLALLDALIESEKAHIRLLMSRLADDWLWRARLRPRVTDHIFSCIKSGIFDLSHSHHQAEAIMRDELTRAVSDLWIDQFMDRRCVVVGSDLAEDDRSAVVLAELDETRLSLPWHRLIEVDVDLEFGVQLEAPAASQ